LSSAILYVAIVAIWAGVLIPRWLRRDTSASEQATDETSTPAEAPADPPAAEERPRPSRPRPDDAPRARRPVVPDVRSPREARPVREDGRPGREDARMAREDGRPGREDDREETGEQEHARVLSARRRLLGLLLALTAGSAALAVTRTAAWWVIMPPTVMLVGYLGLLREASKADAERRELLLARAVEAAAAAHAEAEAAAAPAPVPVPVPAPDAEIIKFSPAQNVAAEQDQEFYDQYADAKLRAVGD
jgi:hypothetical protein